MKKQIYLLLLFALIGTLVSGYLSYLHYYDITPICFIGDINSCVSVAESTYSIIFGIPVAFLGFITWLSLLIFTLHIYNHHRKNTGNIHAFTSKVIFAISCLGVFIAGYFNNIMLLKLNAICMWCELSHVLMLISFFIAFYLVYSQTKKNWFRYAFFFALILFLIPFVLGLVVFNNPNEIELTQCLSEKNLTMYGTFWCPHCLDQKEMFGEEAFSYINYVECADPNQPNMQLKVCKDAGIDGYPTWVNAHNEKISGAQSFDTLREWAGC